MHPQTLAQMRDCYRPLLVFAAGPGDARLVEQTRLLDAGADDMVDRFVLMVPVVPKLETWKAPLDAPYAVLPAGEVVELRARFHVPAGHFRTVLVGEDGSEKMASAEPVPAARLNGIIDAMPTRRVEMGRPHSN